MEGAPRGGPLAAAPREGTFSGRHLVSTSIPCPTSLSFCPAPSPWTGRSDGFSEASVKASTGFVVSFSVARHGAGGGCRSSNVLTVSTAHTLRSPGAGQAELPAAHPARCAHRPGRIPQSWSTPSAAPLASASGPVTAHSPRASLSWRVKWGRLSFLPCDGHPRTELSACTQ